MEPSIAAMWLSNTMASMPASDKILLARLNKTTLFVVRTDCTRSPGFRPCPKRDLPSPFEVTGLILDRRADIVRAADPLGKEPFL